MKLIESIYKEPEKWRLTEHWFKYEGGAMLWIANGPTSCAPHKGYLSVWDRISAWRAYKAWCKTADIAYFGDGVKSKT